MAPSALALALCVALLLARRTDGESLLRPPCWLQLPRSLWLSPTAPGRLLCSALRLKARHRAGDRDGEGVEGKQ